MVGRFAIFGFGNIFASIIPFVLLPYLTKNISPEKMGEIAFLESVVLILAPLITFGIDGFYSVSFNKVKTSELGQLNYTLILIPLVFSIILFPFIWCLAQIGVFPLSLNTYLVVLIVPVCLFQALIALGYSHFQMSGAAATYALIRVCVSVVSAVVTVYFLSVLNLTLEGRVIGIYSGFIVGGACSLLALKFYGVLNFSRVRIDFLRKGIRFGFGMVAHSWSGIIFFASDRIILGYLVEQSELGVYAIAAQIGMVMSIFQNTFSQVWVPHAFHALSKKLNSKLLRDSILAVGLLSLTAIAFILIVPFVFLHLVDDKYSGMAQVTYWTVAAYFFLGVYKVFVVRFFYLEKTKLLAIITSFSALLNLILTFILVEKMGAIGAAIATCASSFVFANIVFWVSLRFSNSEYGEDG